MFFNLFFTFFLFKIRVRNLVQRGVIVSKPNKKNKIILDKHMPGLTDDIKSPIQPNIALA